MMSCADGAIMQGDPVDPVYCVVSSSYWRRRTGASHRDPGKWTRSAQGGDGSKIRSRRSADFRQTRPRQLPNDRGKDEPWSLARTSSSTSLVAANLASGTLRSFIFTRTSWSSHSAQGLMFVLLGKMVVTHSTPFVLYSCIYR